MDNNGSDQPLRIIRGPRTGLGDPHGVFYDGIHNEIVVANHGSVSVSRRRRGRAAGAVKDHVERARGRRIFEAPSITVYPGAANGDVAPVPRIQGLKTGLNWPMAPDV